MNSLLRHHGCCDGCHQDHSCSLSTTSENNCGNCKLGPFIAIDRNCTPMSNPIPMCCGIALGVNSSPTLSLNEDAELISTVTITVNDSDNIVRLLPSIWSATSSSLVTDPTLRGNTVEFFIIRTSDNAVIRLVFNTNFDEMVTTFTALDQPGAGTFTYNLFGRLIRSTTPVQSEVISSVNFTAEQLSGTT
ncbi:hypothetical protein ACFTQ7_23180 [Lysinibacillus sp. NPDC056959]|uniref:hypothetical protein n=1 Tax=Lysinibacillus sp. NPDC056959 TaxID=3345981 RepID=UPI0036385DD7